MPKVLEKRGIDYYWFSVTNDQYEFPVGGIYDNLTDYALAVGKSENAIRSAVCRSERRGRWSHYRRVRKETI